MKNLQQELGSLSVAEKFDLLDALWESLEGECIDLTDEQMAEIDRRAARYGEGPEQAVPWEQVRANVFERP